jgi:hypothetical protein
LILPAITNLVCLPDYFYLVHPVLQSGNKSFLYHYFYFCGK